MSDELACPFTRARCRFIAWFETWQFGHMKKHIHKSLPSGDTIILAKRNNSHSFIFIRASFIRVFCLWSKMETENQQQFENDVHNSHTVYYNYKRYDGNLRAT